MADNGQKVFKLPRHLIARMVDDNPQAIKALENLQVDVVKTLPEQIEQLTQSLDNLHAEVLAAVQIALNALVVAEQGQAQLGFLATVAVADEPVMFLYGV